MSMVSDSVRLLFMFAVFGLAFAIGFLALAEFRRWQVGRVAGEKR